MKLKLLVLDGSVRSTRQEIKAARFVAFRHTLADGHIPTSLWSGWPHNLRALDKPTVYYRRGGREANPTDKRTGVIEMKKSRKETIEL